MKLYTALSLFCLGAGALTMLAPAGCSSDDSNGGSSGTTPASAGRVPPSPPSGAAPATLGDSKTFAVNSLFLGETNRDKSPNPRDGWKDYGYNLDSLTTAKDSKDVCTRVGGADSAKQEDGKEGIDNAFGKTILSFILGLVPTPSKTLNDSISSGAFTIMLDVKGLTDDPNQSATGLSARLLVGGPFDQTSTDPATAKKPTFTPADDWPYRANPIVPIEGAYINNGTFVNGSKGATVELSLFIQGVALTLNIRNAIITFDHKTPTDLSNGTIAGVVSTEELVTGIEKVAGRISEQLCSGNTLETIKTTIRQASDILSDGTNRAGVPCDAISIGIGFTGKQIGNPKTVAKEEAAPADPCKGGADAGP